MTAPVASAPGSSPVTVSTVGHNLITSLIIALVSGFIQFVILWLHNEKKMFSHHDTLFLWHFKFVAVVPLPFHSCKNPDIDDPKVKQN